MKKINKTTKKKLVNGLCIITSVLSIGTIYVATEKAEQRTAAVAKHVQSLPQPKSTIDFNALIEDDLEELDNKIEYVGAMEADYKNMTLQTNSVAAAELLNNNYVQPRTDFDIAVNRYRDRIVIIKNDLLGRMISEDTAKMEIEEAKKAFDTSYKNYRLQLSEKFQQVNNVGKYHG